MTTLPARWRNTNDALRKPLSVTGMRVRARARGALLARLCAVCLAGPRACLRLAPATGIAAVSPAARTGAVPASGRRSGRAARPRARRAARRGRHGAGGCAGSAACGTVGRRREPTAARRGATGARQFGTRNCRAGGVCGGTADGDLARVDDPGRGRWRAAQAERPRAAGCSAAAAEHPQRVWACRPRSSYPRGPAPGARCHATGSCRGRGPPRPARARPAPRARRVPALPSAAAAPDWSRGRCPAGRSVRRRRSTATA